MPAAATPPTSDSVTIGLDVGGTKVAGGLVSATNVILASRQEATVVAGERDPGLAVTLRVATALMAEAGRCGMTVDGIGAGFPEYVDRTGALRSHEVLAWTTQPAAMLADLAPVTIDSDVRCAAIGEGAVGVARGLESYAFVIVGTGISYALVEDGRARTGVRGEAIALGELEVSRSVDLAGPASLEGFASGHAICERYEAQTGRQTCQAAEVFSLAVSGDTAADSVVRSAGQALGEALGLVVRLLDPGAIVIGGGVSRAGGTWRAALESGYAARSGSRPSPPPVLWATLGSDAGVIGAAIAHRQRVSGAHR